MENKQPTGEAKNSQKKEWYKKWWGILIALAIWPLFGIWYVINKTNWKDENKGFAIIGIIALAWLFYGTSKSSETKPQPQAMQQTQAPAQETKQIQNPQPTQPQAPQFTFDVPSLVGKNIDDIKATLGNPTEYTAPTKQQLALSDVWDMSYTKDGVSLLVTYNTKTKVISDFFIDGSDKNKLLAQGNLKENDGNYSVEFVKSITNPNEITGVKVAKKLSDDLDANVTYNAIAFKIENKEDYSWTNCKFELNGGGKVFSGGYEFISKNGIKAKDSVIIPFSEFTKDSKRFDFYAEKPENLFIACETNGQHRTNYFAIN